MKTKTFFLICLFLGIGLFRLSAQVFPPVVKGTKSVAFTMEWDWIGGYFTPVYCPNEQGVLVPVDEVTGSVIRLSGSNFAAFPGGYPKNS